MYLTIAHTPTSRFLGGIKVVHFNVNIHMFKALVDANEELPGRWTKISLIRAKDLIKKSSCLMVKLS